jgi:hypothetical protein
MIIDGGCHCGNIAFALDWPGTPSDVVARACSCTFCVKHGGVWTSNPHAKLSITFQQTEFVSKYSFGTKTATFHVCTRCGAVPFVTSEIDGRRYAVVNVNTFEDFDWVRLRRQSADFEDEDRPSRLLRRQRNWIPDVRIHEGTP